jgi:hypothetical protein
MKDKISLWERYKKTLERGFHTWLDLFVFQMSFWALITIPWAFVVLMFTIFGY